MINIARQFTAAALVLIGLYLAIFGNSWGPLLFEPLETTEIGAWITLIVPFLPIMFIGLGAALLASRHRTDL
jgi:ABC-type dipeptide/oligopeptide/nickel transport system permease subunit